MARDSRFTVSIEGDLRGDIKARKAGSQQTVTREGWRVWPHTWRRSSVGRLEKG